jgi:hypothetical protein
MQVQEIMTKEVEGSNALVKFRKNSCIASREHRFHLMQI